MGAHKHIGDEPLVKVLTGEADIDISEANYAAAAQALLTITPDALGPLRDVEVVLDLAKATTGFAALHTTQTILFSLQRKVDGTNWRTETPAVHVAVTGTNAAGSQARISVGPVGVDEEARVMVQLSAEAADTEIPYAVNYIGHAAPTITAVAAA